MAPVSSLGALLGAGLFALIATATGLQLLTLLRVNVQKQLDRMVIAAAVGVVLLEVAFFVAQTTRHIEAGVVATLIAGAGLVVATRSQLRSFAYEFVQAISAAPRFEIVLMVAAAAVALWEGFAATAPLTGSDALHYHFTTPLEILRHGFKPDFFLTNGFLIGQGHMLILAGLSLGSEKLALALIWLGGAAAAVAAGCIGRKLVVDRRAAWLIVLAYLLNPIVFWQATSAGSPDLWMGLYLSAAALLIAQVTTERLSGFAVIAGVLAGGLAGAKYTGCIFVAVLLCAFVMQTRSIRSAGIFCLSAIATGLWPYLRNFIWTGDPVFPFALRWIAPEKVNHLALQAIRSTTAASWGGLLRLLKFSFFAALDPEHFSFSQFFGPLLLLFLPLFYLLAKRTPLWRVLLITWAAASLAIGLTSGMPRFLLPILGIALASAFGGAAEIWKKDWRAARWISIASVTLFLSFGLVSMLGYSAAAVAASVGRISREAYLKKRAPDYELTEFLNNALAYSHAPDGAVLIFFRHNYYVQPRFLNGDPAMSWAVDPEKLNSVLAWQEFIRATGIDYVLRAPAYPKQIARPLEELERQGWLTTVAQQEFSAQEGYRLPGTRKTVVATLLRAHQERQ